MKVGDQVTFTVRNRKGRVIHLSSRQGKIINIFGDEKAVIQYRNGRTDIFPCSSLRLKGEQTELTEAFLNMNKEESSEKYVQ